MLQARSACDRISSAESAFPSPTELVDLVARRLGGALKAEHGTGRNIAPFVEAEWGPKAHAVMQREQVGDFALLYTWKGTDPSLPPIMLMAHQDVVPIAPGTEGDWTEPPFDGVIKDGMVWGRGAWDDKGNLIDEKVIARSGGEFLVIDRAAGEPNCDEHVLDEPVLLEEG